VQQGGAVANNHLVLAHVLPQPGGFPGRVLAIGVEGHNIVRLGRADAGLERRAVPAVAPVADHTSPGGLGDRSRVVAGPVIHHDDLTREVCTALAQVSQNPGDDLSFVVGRDH
jgi:hypothetical protein